MDGLDTFRRIVAELATEVVEREGAFGMTIGTVHWEAGCCTGDSSFPKNKRFDELTAEDLASTLEGVRQYLLDGTWTTEARDA